MRSIWKPIVIFNNSQKESSKLYNRNSVLDHSFLDQRVLIYNGKKMVSLKIRSSFLLRPIGSFVKTRTVGSLRSKKK